MEDTAVPIELCPECWQVTHIHLGTPVLVLALALGGLLPPARFARCNSSPPDMPPASSMDGHFGRVIILCGTLEPRIHLDTVIILITIIINKAGILGRAFILMIPALPATFRGNTSYLSTSSLIWPTNLRSYLSQKRLWVFANTSSVCSQDSKFGFPEADNPQG